MCAVMMPPENEFDRGPGSRERFDAALVGVECLLPATCLLLLLGHFPRDHDRDRAAPARVALVLARRNVRGLRSSGSRLVGRTRSRVSRGARRARLRALVDRLSTDQRAQP